MRAILGRIALVAVVCASLCGCKGGTNIFAKKKPSDSMSEAPKFAGSPTLPSAGQTPGNMPTNVNGTVAASTPAYNSVDNKFANSTYGSQPAAYQQAVYPTTPYPPVNLAQSQNAGAGATNPPAASHPASGGLVDHTAATPAYGAANPTITYGNNASTGVQPQQGPYNPNYGGASAPQSYAAVPPSSSMNGAAPMAPPASTVQPAAPPDYRVADARGAANAPVQAPAAPAGGNSGMGDRYSHVNTAPWPADRYPNPADNPTATAPAASVPAPAGGVGDRYNIPSNASPPSVPANPPASSPYVQPGDAVAPPAAGNGTSAIPARSGAPYLPGGTSNFSPRSNSLRPTPTDAPPSEPSRVIPANYETPTSAAATPVHPAAATTTVPTTAAATTTNNSAESYGTYQGASAQPADAGSNATAAQPGLFHGHSW
jgi:hypothetical protein